VSCRRARANAKVVVLLAARGVSVDARTRDVVVGDIVVASLCERGPQAKARAPATHSNAMRREFMGFFGESNAGGGDDL
jgi:hypothetical protein